jgi:conjugative transfer ATPase
MRPFDWFRKPSPSAIPTVPADAPDAWARHVAELKAHGIPEPGQRVREKRPATLADEEALYEVAPSFVDLLPWAEYLPESRCLLLDDGVSVAAVLELTPLGTEGREAAWLGAARDALENALQDSFDELDESPWVAQFYVQDETDWRDYLAALDAYLQPRAQGTAFSDFYRRFFSHHLRAISRAGGLFEDQTVTRLPWRGQTRQTRLVIYRRVTEPVRRGHSPEQMLSVIRERLAGGLANAGIRARNLSAADLHAWLLRWFHPHPALLGPTAEDRERFYLLAAYPEENEPGEIELASGTDFAQRLFFSEPRSDAENGLWFFDERPHRVMVVDRLRAPPAIGHMTGETRKGGDAIHAVFDQLPEDTVMCLTLVITPQDILESHLNQLAKKAVGETLASEQTRRDVEEARGLIGSAHKLYRGTLAFYLRGRDVAAGSRWHKDRERLLSARARCGGTGRSRPAALQRAPERRFAAGARGG